jgi:predicted Zn-dependent protease with MMP-like domain
VIDVPAEQFEQLVATALDGLPERLGRLMRNVAVLVADDPPQTGLLGLYEGVPLTERGTMSYAGVLPDRITVYRRPICARAQTEAEVVHEVLVTVVHEVAHHFGIDDERLHDLGWG